MTNFTENFTETQYKSIPGQISTNESLGIVECFAAAIGNKDSVGDICLPGCFDSSLRRRKPRVVWGHSWNEPIGKVLDIYEVGPNDPRLPAKMRVNGVGGLYARVQINLKSERGREAFSNIQFFGEEQEWSIGYKTLDATYDNQKKANLLKEVELYEVSPVLHGANQLTGTISVKSDNQALKDPDGGLTAAGRAHFKRTEGSNLKPGVKGPADTPQKMRRKGSFLTRFFTNPSGPMKGDNGKPTRLALSAAAWGEPVPQNMADAAELAAKGRRLLERYSNTQKKSDEQSEMKYSPIYSRGESSLNPANGRMGELARQLSMHFGGQVTVREADENTVIFDLDKNDSVSTMRAGWHTPDGERFMFGAANQVKPETVYIPLNDGPSIALPGEPKRFVNGGDFYDALMRRDSEVNGDDEHGDCGCGCKGSGSCGVGKSAMKSWSSFKDDTPGLHMFVKTQSVEMYEVANEIGNQHGFDVELLSDGFAIPNMDWYGPEAQNVLMGALEAISEKAMARSARRAIGRGRSAGALKRRSTHDGDGDGKYTNPVTGEDDVPYVKPMMPEKPQEIPNEVPEKQPVKVPVRPSVPSRPSPAPAPATPRPVPQRVPVGGVAGAMSTGKRPFVIPGAPGMTEEEFDRITANAVRVDSNRDFKKIKKDMKKRLKRGDDSITGNMALKNPGENLLVQLREFENDSSNPSGSPKRAMDAAIRHLAKRNNISEEKVRRRLRQAVLRDRRRLVLERAARARGKSELSIYVSISENHDLEVKSGMQISSNEIDAFQIDIHPVFIFDIKSVVDEIAKYHGFSATANDNGIQIKGIASVGIDAVKALVNAISETEKQQPLELYELAHFAK